MPHVAPPHANRTKEISMRTFRAFLLTFAVAGCATPEQRAAQMQREVDQMIELYGPGCDKLGYTRDTDPWRDCVLKLHAQNTINRFTYRPQTTSCIGHRGFFQCTTL
jgi:hypothetical protein